jgi:hypothetical protein
MMDKDQMQKLVEAILQEIAQDNLKKLTEQNDVALSTKL